MNPVHAYHERSKHHLDRYAPGPGGLDWATQPDPFRRFSCAPQVDLSLLRGDLPVAWDDLFQPGRVPPWAGPPGRLTATRAGPCVATLPAAICIPARAT